MLMVGGLLPSYTPTLTRASTYPSGTKSRSGKHEAQKDPTGNNHDSDDI